jgi:hypothetical protein
MLFDTRRREDRLMAQSYAHYSLPQLWQIVAGEDPETGFTHVNTLNRLRTALEHQRDNLRAQRDRLMEGWPPDRSEAAAAFVTHINEMIDAMTYTASAASRICVGIDGTYAAIRDARRQLEALRADYPHRSTGQGIAVLKTSDPALDQRARAVMIAADADIASAAKSYSNPLPPYRRSIDNGQLMDTGKPSSGSGGGVGSAGRSDGSGRALLRPPVFDPPPPSSVGDGRSNGGTDAPAFDDPGPVLSGGPINPAIPPDGGSSGGSPGHPGSPGWGPVGVIGGVGPDRVRPGPGGTSALRPGVVGPDGVIGGVRPSSAVTGQIMGGPTSGVAPRTAAVRGPRSRPTPGTSSSSEPAAARGMGGPAGGFRDRSYEAYAERRRSKRGDDDQLWSVEEGVSPLLEAAPERQRHDPGPGVLGIDR